MSSISSLSGVSSASSFTSFSLPSKCSSSSSASSSSISSSKTTNFPSIFYGGMISMIYGLFTYKKYCVLMDNILYICPKKFLHYYWFQPECTMERLYQFFVTYNSPCGHLSSFHSSIKRFYLNKGIVWPKKKYGIILQCYDTSKSYVYYGTIHSKREYIRWINCFHQLCTYLGTLADPMEVMMTKKKNKTMKESYRKDTENWDLRSNGSSTGQSCSGTLEEDTEEEENRENVRKIQNEVLYRQNTALMTIKEIAMFKDPTENMSLESSSKEKNDIESRQLGEQDSLMYWQTIVNEVTDIMEDIVASIEAQELASTTSLWLTSFEDSQSTTLSMYRRRSRTSSSFSSTLTDHCQDEIYNSTSKEANVSPETDPEEKTVHFNENVRIQEIPREKEEEKQDLYYTQNEIISFIQEAKKSFRNGTGRVGHLFGYR